MLKTMQLVLPVFRILISFMLILSTLVPHTSLQAAPAVQSEDANAEFMLYLPMPQPEAFEMIQGRVRPERLDIFTNRILREAELPLIAELNRQVREGKIKHYTFRPEQFAFQVRTKGGPLDDVLIKYAAMVAPVVEELPACAVQSVEALKRQVITTGMLRSSEKQDAMQAKSGAMILETKPHIELGFYSDSVTSVRGYVSPNQDVTMEVYRDGSLVITEQTKSFSDGYYYVSASYNSCPKSGYEWKIIPGDTVRISDRVAVYQMTAVRVQASVDPTKNQVYGYTNPGDYVKIDLSQYDFSLCTNRNTTSDMVWTTADARTGYFNANFFDFNSDSSAKIYTYDAEGNVSSFYVYSFGIGLPTYSSGQVEFGFTPKTDFRAEIVRNGVAVDSVTGTTSIYGHGSFKFSINYIDNDLIRISGGDTFIETIFHSVTIYPDTKTKTISGKASPGSRVEMFIYTPDFPNWVRGCGNTPDDCFSATANEEGNFIIPLQDAPIPGDTFIGFVLNADGNFQDNFDNPTAIPTIGVELTDNWILGTWYTLLNDLTITHKSSDQSVINSYFYDSEAINFDNTFDVFVENPFQDGDFIEVTDGTYTQTMTIDTSLVGRIPYGKQDIEITTPAGHLVIKTYRFHNRSIAVNPSYCIEKDVTSGDYRETNPEAFNSFDQLDLILRVGDNYLHRNSQTFNATVEKGTPNLSGYTETTNTTLTIIHNHDGVLLPVVQLFSNEDRFFKFHSSAVIDEGDEIVISTGDGTDATVKVPVLSLTPDSKNNRIRVESYAEAKVFVQLRQFYGENNQYSHYAYGSVTTNSTGVGFYYLDNLGWTRECASVKAVADCLQIEGEVNNSEDFMIKVKSPRPAPILADEFEPVDNTRETALAYQAGQMHTLHNGTDGDWVTFTVPARINTTASTRYYFRSAKLGSQLEIEGEMYREGETEPYGSFILNGRYSTEAVFSLPPGTYDLYIKGYSSSDSGGCNAFYSLLLYPENGLIYFPFVSN